MTPVPATANQPEAPLFTDGLGDRVVAVDAATGDLLQILRVRPQLLAVPVLRVRAARARAARLANFRHAYYARVRRIDRHPSGLRDCLGPRRRRPPLRTCCASRTSATCRSTSTRRCACIRQVVPSIALLHENARDVAHGLARARAADRHAARAVIVVEHVLGSGGRAAAVQPRAAVAGAARVGARVGRRAALRSPRRRDGDRPDGAGARCSAVRSPTTSIRSASASC